jgi:hypothetical protein
LKARRQEKEGIEHGKYSWQRAASSNEDWGLNTDKIALGWIPDIRRRRIPG